MQALSESALSNDSVDETDHPISTSNISLDQAETMSPEPMKVSTLAQTYCLHQTILILILKPCKSKNPILCYVKDPS